MEQDEQAKRILIVDDDEGITLALTLIVEEAGYTPVCASHGKRALEILRQQSLDLVITDLMMPHLDGAQLIAQVRADADAAGRPPPPLVLMTAAGAAIAKQAGADAFLSKPFDVEQVEQLLSRFLATRA